LLAEVSAAAHTDELYMYTYIHPLDNYRLIKALISSSDRLPVANDLPIEEITSVQEGVSGTSIEDPTYDVAAGWTAVADDDGDGSRGRRGTVVGDQVHPLVAARSFAFTQAHISYV